MRFKLYDGKFSVSINFGTLEHVHGELLLLTYYSFTALVNNI